MQLPAVHPTSQGPSFGKKARGFGGCDPFVNTFLYTPKGSFFLVGWKSEVEAWIERTTDTGRGQMPFVRHTLFWKGGAYRGFWHSNVFYIQSPSRPYSSIERSRRTHFEISPREGNGRSLRLKRMPKAWIASYDALLDPKFDWKNAPDVQ